MKPRILQPYKILAAVLTVTCAPAVAGTAFAAQPPTDDQGYPLVGNLVRKGDGTARPKPQPAPKPTPAPTPAPAPTPKPAND